MKSVNIMKSVKLFLSNLAIIALVLVLSNCGGGETAPTPQTAKQIAGGVLAGTWNVTGVQFNQTERTDATATALKGVKVTIAVDADSNGGGITLSNVPTGFPLANGNWMFANDNASQITFGTTTITVPATIVAGNPGSLTVDFTISGTEVAPSGRTFGLNGAWKITLTK